MRNFLYNLATDKYMGFFASVMKFLLFILSLIYSLSIRLWMLVCERRQYRPGCKVISVGNITLGGTGKTPLVEYIVKYLKANGHSVAVVTRGYKRKLTTHNSQLTTFEYMGDEPYMLQEKLKDIPVIVDVDRVRAIKSAVDNYGADAVILDDGFQQWRIKKDLEIIVIDAGNPFGNRQMIPGGILRQPLSSLKKADIFVLTKTDINPGMGNIIDFLKSINPDALIVETVHNPTGFVRREGERLGIHAFAGQSAVLVSGIGDPDSFERTVENLGVSVRRHFKFQDHHNYSAGDIEKIAEFCKQGNINIIVTTEKDAVRFYGLRITDYGLRVLILSIELKVTRYESEFSDRLSGVYSF